MATDPVNEIIEGRTREQWVERFEAHFESMHCTMWGQARSNWSPKDRRANAEYLTDLVRAALGYEDADDEEFAEYLESQREVAFTISWQPSEVSDQGVVDEISHTLDGLMDMLSDDDVADLSSSGTIVRADAKWPVDTEPEGDAS